MNGIKLLERKAKSLGIFPFLLSIFSPHIKSDFMCTCCGLQEWLKSIISFLLAACWVKSFYVDHSFSDVKSATCVSSRDVSFSRPIQHGALGTLLLFRPFYKLSPVRQKPRRKTDERVHAGMRGTSGDNAQIHRLLPRDWLPILRGIQRGQRQ